MFLAEPPPSQADVHFRLFGIPVRVSPWFWIVSLMMAIGIGGDEKADPIKTLLWVAVVFVSILVHELGHAFVQRRFGGRPWITLYGLGGMASCGDCDRSPTSQILISLAGPLAGFMFAALILAAIRLAGHTIQFGVLPGLIGLFLPAWEPLFAAPAVNLVIFDLLYVNIFWGLVNLLPIYPLDGGHVARELFTLNQPRSGIVQSLWLSVVVAGAMALFGLSRNSLFITVMFGYLAYASYQIIRAYDRY
jgi:Zn-dependent protease